MCLILSVIIGIVGAWLQGSRLKWTRRIVQGYIQFFRNTPPLVQLYFFYFALGSLMPKVQNDWGGYEKTIIAWTPLLLKGFGFNILISFMSMAIGSVIGLSLPVMANVAEIVRGAVNSIPSGQWEVSESLAFTRRQQIWLIILPQCYKRMLPPWINSNLEKSSAWFFNNTIYSPPKQPCKIS